MTASQKITSQRKESLQIFLNLIKNGDENLNIFELPLISYSSCLKKNKDEVSEASFGLIWKSAKLTITATIILI